MKKKSFFSRYRIVYRHSPVLLKCAILVTIVLSVAALTVLRVCITQENQRGDALRVQAAQFEQKNSKLKQITEQKDTEEGIKAIAEEYLGMAENDTVLHDVVTNQD